MKKFIAITFSFLAVISTATAQHWCGSTEHRDELKSERPEIAKEVERRFNSFNQRLQENEANGVKNSDHYVIPVVFHVIHKGGSENISFEQIEDQMSSLNEDFAYLNADKSKTPSQFRPYTGDANIEFRLAQKDPDGYCTQGVTRTYSLLTSSANNNVKEMIQWDPNRYLNVWIVDDIDRNSDYGTILGYAQFPDQLWSNPETDGIVMLHNYCGSIETASNQVGRTLTHEIGHWLNLRHIWGDASCGNDQVNDTPTAVEPNFGVCLNSGGTIDSLYNAPIYTSSVEYDTINEYYHEIVLDSLVYVIETDTIITVTTEGCTIDSSFDQTISQDWGEMYMNYMDYTDDNCMNMFSLLQGERMRAAILEYRDILVSDANLISTGTNDAHIPEVCAAIPVFTSDYIYGCPGDAYSFYNGTYNVNFDLDPEISYEWSFEGGTPSSSSEESPEDVVFETPGIFTVSLTATNSAGVKMLVQESYIYVTDDDTNMSFPYKQDFESSEFPTYTEESLNWIVSTQTDPTWESTSEVSSPTYGGDMSSVRIRSAVFTEEGELHTLVTPTIDLSNASPPINAYFDYAYAKKNPSSNDVVRVYISDDCGRSWTVRRTLDTEMLISNGTETDTAFVFLPFVPAESEWETSQVSLSTLAGEKNIQVKFEFIGYNGNWLYLDNFIVSNPAEFSIAETVFNKLSIYPNPSKGDVTIEFELYKKASIGVTISNVFGATLASKVLSLDASKNSIQLKDVYPSLKAGIYFIQLDQNSSTVTKKIVITD